MGCLHSKKETLDLHPNVYRVVNIDENGVELWTGQLEITENDIVLYREGRDATRWPLHSLRRYGYEDDIFSFESGRRCETGEGIYAFRCRRASLLFRNLQHRIHMKNYTNNDGAHYAGSRLPPSPQGRQIVQASVVHRSSVDHGLPDENGPDDIMNTPNPTLPPTRPVTHNAISISSSDILEVMPLYPRAQTSNNQVTNVYQMRDFKREHNNNQSVTDPHHVYSNDITRDLAILRSTLKHEAAINTMRDFEDETTFLEGRYVNENLIGNKVNLGTLSPTQSSSSEHYAQLSIEQRQKESCPLYMNIVSSVSKTDDNKNDLPPATPLTPKQVDYCNLNVGVKPEVNSYANLSLGEVSDSVKNVKQKLHFTIPEHAQKFSESDTCTSISPVDELEVNYAVLDIDSNRETTKMTRDLISPESQSYNSSKNESTTSCSSHARSRLVSQTSLEKPTPLAAASCASIGYTTIDFDKTVALSSVASGTDEDSSTRKTRHNSSNVNCSSPISIDKVEEKKVKA